MEKTINQLIFIGIITITIIVWKWYKLSIKNIENARYTEYARDATNINQQDSDAARHKY